MSKTFKVEVTVEAYDEIVLFEVVRDVVAVFDETDHPFKLKRIAAGQVGE